MVLQLSIKKNGAVTCCATSMFAGGRISAEYRRGGGSVTDHGYDVYELLGVEPEAPLSEIKQAYRWLQKRCHPDIAGPVGHDMAILLNDAYTILSDPMQRAAYDVVSINC